MQKRKRILIAALAVFLLMAFMLVMFIAAMMLAEEMQQFKTELYKKLPWRAEYVRQQETDTDYSAYPVMEHSADGWYNSAKLILHACGGIDGLDYTNSREAMESSLEREYRFVEVDFAFSSDGVPVCAHSWSDLRSDVVMDHESFMSHKVFGKYTPLDLEMVLDYMERFPELYIVLDTKDSMVELVRAILEYEPSEDVMNRFIIQVYGAGEKPKIMEMYSFPEENFLFTAYRIGNRPGYIMQLCYDENISVVTLPYEWFSDDWHFFVEKEFVLYAHTVNRPDDARELISRGVYGLYTDFLSLPDLEQ